MASFLRRISSPSQFNRGKKPYAGVYFEIDEPDFLLKRKFSATPMDNSNWRVQQFLKNSNPRVCPSCGNTQISNQAKFCRVCGAEILFD